MYENFIVGPMIDESHKDIDFRQLAKNSKFVVINLGGRSVQNQLTFIDQNVFSDMVQKAYDAGLAVGVHYDLWAGYWVHTNRTMKDVENMINEQHPIVSGLMKLLRYKAVSFLSLGVYETSVVTGSGEVTNSWMSYAVRDVVDRLQSLQRKNVLLPFKIGIYSRRDFVIPRFSSLDDLLSARTDLFIAVPKWVRISQSAISVYDLFSNRPSASEPVTFGWAASRETAQNRGKIWSFWDLGKQPVSNVGVSPVGYFMFNGTMEDFAKLFNPKIKADTQPNPQPEPQPEPEPEPGGDATTELLILAELKTISQILSQINTKLK